MRKYNKGEWSEIYTFAYLLSSGILYSADKDLNKIDEIYFPVLKIIREEIEGQPIDYKTGDVIRIYNGDELLKEVEKSQFDDVVAELFDKIPQGSRAFEIPSVDDFFDSIYCTKVKAASNKKQDITVQLHDINTGIKPICGFSIKSYLGANPTLINAGTNTNFTYTLKGCTDELMDAVNGIETRTKIIDRIQYLLDNGCTFELQDNSISAQFTENLQFIDTIMPTFINYMLLYGYRYSIKSSAQLIDKMKELNPLGFPNLEMYTYKYKKLLCAWALGLTPERTDWLGNEDANGGYITVKNDGSVVCYHLYNRTEFENYLFDYTYFDKPSTSKFHYMSVFKEDGEYKIKLCLQVRFR